MLLTAAYLLDARFDCVPRGLLCICISTVDGVGYSWDDFERVFGLDDLVNRLGVCSVVYMI